MRKQLLLSTGTVCLMLASGLAYAQAPGGREEPKRVEDSAKGAAQHGQGRAQEQSQRGQEHSQGAASRQEREPGRQAEEDKNRPSAAERNQPRPGEQAQDRGRGGRDAEPGKERGESGRGNAEVKGEKGAAQKSTAESERSKNSAAGAEKEHQGAAPTSTQNERAQSQRNEPSRNASEQQQGTTRQDNRPAATNETRPGSTNAQTTPTGPGNQNQAGENRTNQNQNQATQTQGGQTQIDRQAGNLPPDRQVRISETISRTRIEPERNLNISIRVGETVPPRVRLHRLPPEIVSIEPEYRDYEYFATDDNIVIVEPQSHRIVSEVPRDPARTRAQIEQGGGSMVAANTGGGGAVSCRIMRRDASGNIAEVSSATVGSTARQDSISVTVQMPGGDSSAPIALGAPAGDIVVATQGQGDCTVTLEPQTR